MSWKWLDERPIIIALAGPNGAGKTTFYHSHLAKAGLRYVNADRLAAELNLDAYAAAEMATRVRQALLAQRASFAFETVFSDPVGEKVEFLKVAAETGYTVVVCFVGLQSATVSEERVAMRVTQGGHDVPSQKLRTRFPRILANLKRAIDDLPHVLVFDNSDLRMPYRQVAEFKNGVSLSPRKRQPTWLKKLLVSS